MRTSISSQTWGYNVYLVCGLNTDYNVDIWTEYRLGMWIEYRLCNVDMWMEYRLGMWIEYRLVVVDGVHIYWVCGLSTDWLLWIEYRLNMCSLFTVDGYDWWCVNLILYFKTGFWDWKWNGTWWRYIHSLFRTL